MTTGLDHCLAILEALQIAEVRYCLSGGGDSGTAELTDVLFADGRHGRIPPVTVAVTDTGTVLCLDECLENIVYDIPDGDWINNEGGHGNVVLRPQETDPAARVECDMTYGEDSDEADFEDEDFIDAGDAPEPVSSDAPVAIDDSALQPAKGDAS
jgi:hypothetical protein